MAGVQPGDVIKAIVADALGMHLDLFQRIIADPCSLTVIRYTETRPFVLRAQRLRRRAGLIPPSASARRGQDQFGRGRRRGRGSRTAACA